MDQTYTVWAYRSAIYCFSSWSAQFSLIHSTIHRLLQGNTRSQIFIRAYACLDAVTALVWMELEISHRITFRYEK